MKDWYTRQEVADLLGISKTTVYHYAKQKKIFKIEDPHRTIREARYKRDEVDELVEAQKRNKPTGLRPSELAKQLGVPVTRIYTIIKDNDLPVDEIILGDEMKGYSISNELAEQIQLEVIRTTPIRGTLIEFYNSKYGITLYQRFLTSNGQDIRLIRNDDQEWGFYLQSRTWIPFEEGVNMYNYTPAYSIHQQNIDVKGYADFLLPKGLDESFDFLDFVYEVWGVENIRMREQDAYIELSIKSGVRELHIPAPESISQAFLATILVAGDVNQYEDNWDIVSGYRGATIDLPNNLYQALQNISKQMNMSMTKYGELAIKEKIERDSKLLFP